MTYPVLPPQVLVQPGLDVADLFERFEVFEALHRSMPIASPMSSDDLDAVVGLMGPTDGEVALDLGCGSGELLLRLTADADAEVAGVGVDLSPWMILAAHERARALGRTGVDWVVGEAREWRTDPQDLVACLGASWIWHGLEGTVRAVAERTRPGGRLAIGDMRRRDTVSADELAARHGPLPGPPEIDSLFESNGVDVLGVVTTSDAAWDDYLARTERAFLGWEAEHRGDRAEEFREVLVEWQQDQERDREVLVWSVWVGRKR